MSRRLWIASASSFVLIVGGTPTSRRLHAGELCEADRCATVAICQIACNRCEGTPKKCKYVEE